jgi:2-dehydro-3-deoxygluconokinase
MKKVFCFGEILLRMSPAVQGEWIKEGSTSLYIGGAELNVAFTLSKWNIPVKYCSAAPDNWFTNEILAHLKRNNINTSAFQLSGDRLGTYMLPHGTDLKNARVIYDRAHSAFSEILPETINWQEQLKDVSWVHVSAITPALNTQVAQVCLEMAEAASAMGIKVSIDLNYRSQLWRDREPVGIMSAIVAHCDVVMGNIWSANSLLRIPIDEHIHDKKSKEAYIDHATATAAAIMQQFPRCKSVANTFRFDTPNGIQYYATLNETGNQVVSQEFQPRQIVDKVGSGDCFMSGLIYGKLNFSSSQQVIDFAAAAAVGKMFEVGDSTSQTVAEILQRVALEAGIGEME